MRISDWSSDVCSSDLLYTPFGKPAYLFWLVEAGENGVRQPSLDQERPSCRDESGDCHYGKRMHRLRSWRDVKTGWEFTMVAHCLSLDPQPEKTSLRSAGEIGRAHVVTQATNAHIV